MGLAVIILRTPDLAILTFYREGLIGQPTGQGVLTGALESRQVNRRFDQRTNWPHRIEHPVETGKARLATTNHRLYFAGFRVAHQHGRLNLLHALAPTKTLEGLTQRGLGLDLQDRIEAGEDAQPLLGQVFLTVILTQLALDQIKERRERTVGQTAALGNGQRLRFGLRRLLHRHHALLNQQIDHQIAARQRALGIAARIVVGRPLDHPHQQRHLMQLQLGQRLTEEVLTGQTEAMHRTLAILPEEHLVQVRLQNGLLVVVQFQQHGHHGLGQLALQAALTGQIEILHQLLGQGASALTQLACRGIDPDRTGNRLERNAVMIPEFTILDRHQGFHQVGRHLIKLDKHTVFMMRGIQPADQHWFKTGHRQCRTIGLAQAGDIAAGETHPNALRRLQSFIKLEAPAVQLHRIAVNRNCPGAIADTFAAIAQGRQLGQEVLARKLLPDEQLQRPRIDLGRHRPALTGEFLLHHGIQVHGKTCQHHQADQAQLEQQTQPGPR